MTDYYSILSRAVAALDPNTAQARTTLFDRARNMMLDRIRDPRSRWSEAEIRAEIDNFEATISRIESENAQRPVPVNRQRREPAQHAVPPPAREAAAPHPKRVSRVALWSVVGMAALLTGGALYLLLSGGQPSRVKPTTAEAPKATVQEPASRRSAGLTIDENEVAPGVDGDSSDARLPYFFRRQAVYYRTTYSAGMMVVDRSQRFLYLVQPQVRALRYGIGVGGECAASAGLYRVTRRVEWPEWSPSPDLAKRRSYPAKVAGGPGNPLGARALYFEAVVGIHGTNAPKSIGHALTLGCFRLTNEDVVDLDKRIEIGAGVVVTN